VDRSGVNCGGSDCFHVYCLDYSCEIPIFPNPNSVLIGQNVGRCRHGKLN